MTVLLTAFSALLGLLIGSFLNVVIWRVPRGESVASPPSHCPGCERPIRPRDNVPVLSWLLLRGRCRDCRTAISARYPAVELGTAVVFGVLAWHFGFDWALPAYLYLGAISVALAMIDIDVHRLPDAIVLPSYGFAAVLLLTLAFGWLKNGMRCSPPGLAALMMTSESSSIAYSLPGSTTSSRISRCHAHRR